jgi:hypothetical protein
LVTPVPSRRRKVGQTYINIGILMSGRIASFSSAPLGATQASPPQRGG